MSPLKKGSSKTTVSKNIQELMHKWKQSGSIGTSKPSSVGKANKQAVAIALEKAGKSTRKKGAGHGKRRK